MKSGAPCCFARGESGYQKCCAIAHRLARSPSEESVSSPTSLPTPPVQSASSRLRSGKPRHCITRLFDPSLDRLQRFLVTKRPVKLLPLAPRDRRRLLCTHSPRHPKTLDRIRLYLSITLQLLPAIYVAKSLHDSQTSLPSLLVHRHAVLLPSCDLDKLLTRR